MSPILSTAYEKLPLDKSVRLIAPPSRMFAGPVAVVVPIYSLSVSLHFIRNVYRETGVKKPRVCFTQ
ncbi:MAG: hypothetical protein ACK44D_07770 [Bacteroidia bacterium]